MENVEYQTKKLDDLQRKIVDAQSTIYHLDLVRSFILTKNSITLYKLPLTVYIHTHTHNICRRLLKDYGLYWLTD